MVSQDLSSRCTSAGRVTASLLLSFLALSTPTTARSAQSGSIQHGQLNQLPPIAPIYSTPGAFESPGEAEQFTLRHLFHHGTYLHPGLHRRKDVLNPAAQLYTTTEDGQRQLVPPLMIRTSSTKMQRLADRRPSVIDPMIAAAREQGETWSTSASAWTLDDVPGPNVTDKATILSLAEMAASAYVLDPNISGWENISLGFNTSIDFGWEGDGLRGHVWANEKNSTIVISLKGTTVAVFDGDETTTADKENDNLFFSCCCGQQGQLTWRKVCDCASGTYSCNSTCVTKSLRQENRYYQAARELYTNVTALYPDSNVWVSGHSLGGAVSSLLGMTYGLPTVTFEAPPEALAAKRLGLPLPPGIDSFQARDFTGTFHVGHTADPIYLGSCNGYSSPCSFGGYAMETACHTGVECAYDVVADLGWRVALTTHSIRSVIDNIIKKYDTAPVCVPTPECYDCPLWKFYESNSSETTTSSSSTSSKTRTRTETCKTPGWWGCLDESTTTGPTTSTSKLTTTTSSSTSTCKTPGWFGCNDITTTTSTTSKSASTATKTSLHLTSTSSCKTPGFFGCNDPTETTTGQSTSTEVCKTPGWWGCNDEPTSSQKTHPITSPPTMPTSTTPTTTAEDHECTSKEWFGLICVDPSPTATEEPSSTSVPHEKTCARRSWLGFCKEWQEVSKGTPEEL